MGQKPKQKSAIDCPSAEEIRACLIARAEEFTRLTGMTPSDLGKAALNDPAFVTDLKEGRNFTIKLYGRFLSYLDDHWPSSKRSRAVGKPA